MGTSNNPRVGVFLCGCGMCTSAVINLSEVAEHVSSLPNVSMVRIYDYACRRESMSEMTKAIVAASVDRAVFAACSPYFYLKRFKSILKAAGLNSSLIHIVNLREQCASVHCRWPDLAAAKAKDQVAMAVARLSAMNPSSHASVALIDKDICDGCGTCKTACKTKSIRVIEDPNRRGRKLAVVDTDTCAECGLCVAVCPSGARHQAYYLSDQIVAQVDVAMKSMSARDLSSPSIIVFTCSACSSTSADLAGLMKLELEPCFRTIGVPCSSSIDPEWILRAFSKGADGVLIIAGDMRQCSSEVSSHSVKRKMALVKMMLMRLGFSPSRLKMALVGPEDPEGYQKEVSSFIGSILELGPNPLRANGTAHGGGFGSGCEKKDRFESIPSAPEA